MEITEEKTEHGVVVNLNGRLDATTAAEVESRLLQVIERKEPLIILDFSQLEFVSSAGLRVLLSTAKRSKAEGTRTVLCSLNPFVLEVFDISGFSSIFEIYPDRQAAAG